ncbi:hypothetical protein ANN_14392 [Periplaneta americana]|uniref:Reverse transcriptase domain-containing protein n=1 Tax=Periplaneta americana TaxID=6978 RepID=A0ABQ8SW67_PERAM|nr:hypothetical protein ANN_14392 [Periplaneta americana]
MKQGEYKYHEKTKGIREIQEQGAEEERREDDENKRNTKGTGEYKENKRNTRRTRGTQREHGLYMENKRSERRTKGCPGGTARHYTHLDNGQTTSPCEEVRINSPRLHDQEWNLGHIDQKSITLPRDQEGGHGRGRTKPVNIGKENVTMCYNKNLHLLNLDFTHRTRVIAFAYDLMVLTQGKTTTDAENYANLDLKKIKKWARENKMHFNEKKSKTLLISRKRSGDDKTLNIYLNNKRLEQVSELKYLGIYLDTRFNFDKHVDYITEKC